MLSSITPLGERGRGRRWGTTVSWYVAGSAVAGTLLGGLLGLVGRTLPPPTAWAAVVLALLCLFGAVLDARLLGARLPTLRRQVNEDWLDTYRGWVIGLGFGVQLGLGITTIVTTSTVYLTLAAALLSGSWPAGALIGAVFGVVRALPQVATGRLLSPAALGTAHRRIAAWAPRAHRLALAAQCVVALGLFARGLS